LNTPVRAHARHASIAFRGRLSPGYFSAKYGSARSAQSAAQIAKCLWSLLLTSSAIGASMLVTAIFDFFISVFLVFRVD
jgi:hypothetical protein